MAENTNTNTDTQIAELEALAKKKAELLKAAKAKKALEAWEAKTKARNPAYVLGSVRKPTAKDEAELGHVHGLVCEIVCQTCGKTRVVNKQDAFQVKFCREHKSEARKAKAKAKRQEQKLAGKSAEDLKAEIAELQAQIATKEATAELTPAEILAVDPEIAAKVEAAKEEAKAKGKGRARKAG